MIPPPHEAYLHIFIFGLQDDDEDTFHEEFMRELRRKQQEELELEQKKMEETREKVFLKLSFHLFDFVKQSLYPTSCVCKLTAKI